jgi:nicotinate (nicotinamide) nucleotide adenylyltransferase
VHGAYSKDGLAPADDRVEMARIAVSGSDWIDVSDWEVKRDEYSRSVDVARHVRFAYGRNDTTVLFVCGSDLVQAMTEKSIWTAESIQNLLKEVVLAVLPRPGADIQGLLDDPVFAGFRDRVWTIKGVFSDVSSSLVRYVRDWHPRKQDAPKAGP